MPSSGNSSDGAPPRRAVPRLTCIHALRGLAAAAVAWSHFTHGAQTEWLRASGAYGWAGVPVFFVISGFVIPYSLHAAQYRPKFYLRYLAKRIIRLEPPYLMSIVFLFALSAMAKLTPLSPSPEWNINLNQLAAHLFYLIPLTDQPWLNDAYWTLTYEFAFYLVLGLAYPLLRTWHLSAVLTATAPFVAYVAAVHGDQVSAALLFFIGIACWRFFVGIDRLTITVPAVAAAAAAAWYLDGPVVAAVALLTFTVIAINPNISSRLLLALGSLSYSLYLLHIPIGIRFIRLGKMFNAPPQAEVLFAGAAMIASLAIAYIFYRLVEEPARQASHAIALDSERPAIPAAAIRPDR